MQFESLAASLAPGGDLVEQQAATDAARDHRREEAQATSRLADVQRRLKAHKLDTASSDTLGQLQRLLEVFEVERDEREAGQGAQVQAENLLRERAALDAESRTCEEQLEAAIESLADANHRAEKSQQEVCSASCWSCTQCMHTVKLCCHKEH